MTHEEFFQDFMQNIYAEAEAGSQFNEPVFVEQTCEFLCDQAVLENYDLVSYKKDRAGMKVDAWEYLSDSGSLTLLVSDFRDSLETLTRTEARTIFKRASRFFEKALDRQFYANMEESDPAWNLAKEIYDLKGDITRLRIIILSNALISKRFQSLEENEIGGFKCVQEIWDIERRFRIQTSATGKEVTVINFEEEFGASIPCLPAYIGSGTYQSFLLAIPGQQMAILYEKYGERLLEQNVRTFLQFRGKVNKGMRNTILNEPHMFFAYNNGITATAEEVESYTQEGSTRIKSLKNLQVVNGGQTTASLYTALRKSKADLENVYVQVKLTVVPPEKVEEVVPRISEYANTQNKVNAADFFSNHPFHLRVEEFSRRLWAPSVEGGMRETRWFYERARGQYANAQANLTPAEKRKFLAQHPRRQMITKTDLAKYHYSWERLPHVVSLGAQKNFAKFAAEASREWEKNEKKFNELYFKEMISKAILFRFLDRKIMKQPWYESYKANIVTYTIAMFSELIGRSGRQFDHEKVWLKQNLSESLLKFLLNIAEEVNRIIQDTPEGITNISEWCKKEQCWRNVQGQMSVQLDGLGSDFLIGSYQAKENQKTAEAIQRIDNGIEAQIKVMDLGAQFWARLWSWNQVSKVLSLKEQDIVNIAKQIPKKYPSEKQSMILLQVLETAIREGFVKD